MLGDRRQEVVVMPTGPLPLRDLIRHRHLQGASHNLYTSPCDS